MFDHIGLHVRDLTTSISFYTAALAPLGFVLCSRDDTSAGFGPKGAPALWLYAAPKSKPTPIHVAFTSSKRPPVDKFHAAGVSSGGKDNGKPGVRADYSPTYYAAFVVDPDGNNVEAVCVG